MKTTSSSPPPSPFGGALNKSNNIYLTILCLIIATLWNTHSVSAAPAKTDLQPPIFEATASSASPSQPNGNSEGTAIDSYGNPIESLQPIETPDGRKVVSAQGLQFEIPNYASGITELKKPADDLLPPFVAPFEPTTVSTTAATTVSGADQKKVPLSADRESFPPFNNVITGSSTLPSKTTFTKSEDGKVITNNIFLSGSLGSTSAKPLGSSFEKNTFSTGSSSTKTTTASTVFKQFGTTSSAASGFVTSPAASTTFSSISTNDGTKYTGRFGGPPGVLAPQSSGFTTSSSTTVTQSFNKPTFTTFGITSSPGLATNNKDKFTGSFGGPPGILKPYDNIKNR